MSMNYPLIAAVSTFIVIVLATSALLVFLGSKETVKTWRRRAQQDSKTEQDEMPLGFIEQCQVQFQALLEWFASLNQPSSTEQVRATRSMLVTAGFRGAKAPIFYTGAKLMVAIVAVSAITAIPAKVLGFPATNTLLFYYLMAASVGYYAPSFWLKRAIANRQDALQRAIPDALDLMVVCVEAGLGLDQAIARVGEEIKSGHPALGEEFNLLGLELRAGVPRQEALRNLAHRTDLDDVKSLVALLVQTDRFGTSIGQALRVHADSMRTTRRLRAEELAAKLPVKLLLPLVFFIFPTMFVVTIGPAVIRMIKILLPAFSGQ